VAGFEAWIDTAVGDGLKVGVAEFPEQGDLFTIEPVDGGPLVALNTIQARALAAYLDAALALTLSSSVTRAVHE